MVFSKRYDKFSLRIGKPVEENIKKRIDDPPDDPLGEYNEFEMGLQRFCYEQNHYVILEVGDQKVNNLAFHRSVISPLGYGVEKVIAQIESGQKGYVSFDDTVFGDGVSLGLTPQGNQMICELNKRTYKLDRSECIQNLKTFFTRVLKMAIEQGYVKAREAEKEFGWKL